MRRYSDPVQVRSAEPSRHTASAETEPDAFVWQGRLYVVRTVLAHWRERRSWWRDALDPAPGQPTGIDVASREQHVWRVEASRGHAYGTGVFDLTTDGVDGAGGEWRLVRVAD
jgi:Family of unknown function (DUF6504)